MSTRYTGNYCIRCGHRQELKHKGEGCVAIVNGKKCNAAGTTPILAQVPWDDMLRPVDRFFLKKYFDTDHTKEPK